MNINEMHQRRFELQGERDTTEDELSEVTNSINTISGELQQARSELLITPEDSRVKMNFKSVEAEFQVGGG